MTNLKGSKNEHRPSHTSSGKYVCPFPPLFFLHSSLSPQAVVSSLLLLPPFVWSPFPQSRESGWENAEAVTQSLRNSNTAALYYKKVGSIYRVREIKLPQQRFGGSSKIETCNWLFGRVQIPYQDKWCLRKCMYFFQVINEFL